MCNPIPVLNKIGAAPLPISFKLGPALRHSKLGGPQPFRTGPFSCLHYACAAYPRWSRFRNPPVTARLHSNGETGLLVPLELAAIGMEPSGMEHGHHCTEIPEPGQAHCNCLCTFCPGGTSHMSSAISQHLLRALLDSLRTLCILRDLHPILDRSLLHFGTHRCQSSCKYVTGDASDLS